MVAVACRSLGYFSLMGGAYAEVFLNNCFSNTSCCVWAYVYTAITCGINEVFQQSFTLRNACMERTLYTFQKLMFFAM